jgi:N-acetylglutamate synthase-like GNAT family acetyltransferase
VSVLENAPDEGAGRHLRVAAHNDQVVGAYLVESIDALTYRIRWVAVETVFRHKGLGSWLIGHAIGISESKGARTLVAPTGYPGSLLARIGFKPCDDEMRLELTPD